MRAAFEGPQYIHREGLVTELLWAMALRGWAEVALAKINTAFFSRALVLTAWYGGALGVVIRRALVHWMGL